MTGKEFYAYTAEVRKKTGPDSKITRDLDDLMTSYRGYHARISANDVTGANKILAPIRRKYLLLHDDCAAEFGKTDLPLIMDPHAILALINDAYNYALWMNSWI